MRYMFPPTPVVAFVLVALVLLAPPAPFVTAVPLFVDALVLPAPPAPTSTEPPQPIAAIDRIAQIKVRFICGIFASLASAVERAPLRIILVWGRCRRRGRR